MRITIARILFVSVGVLSGRSALAEHYSVTDLGALGTSNTLATAINRSGQVVGDSYVNDAGANRRHAFIWDQGTMQDLGLLPGSTSCHADAINDAEEVVGYCVGEVGGNRAFRWTRNEGLIALGQSDSVATGINSNGDIVGTWHPAGTGPNGFVYRNGAFQDLGAGEPAGINDAGQIVGRSADRTRALLWDQDGPHDLGSLEGSGGSSAAWAISADGLVVGDSTTGGPNFERHAVLFSSSGLNNLGSLGGLYASARAISGNLIVGISQTGSQGAGGHAFIYNNAGLGYPVDLNDRIPTDSGWTLGLAAGVNRSGQIVGWGWIGDVGSTLHAFLLTPLPWTTYSVTDLGVLPGGNFASALAISPGGELSAGYSYITSTPYPYHAFLFTNGTMTDLGTLGGEYSIAQGVNDNGEVVGYSPIDPGVFATPHAFVYGGGSMIDLGQGEGFAVNDMGQVVGFYWFTGNISHAFLYDGMTITDLGTLGGSGSSVAMAINAAGVIVGAADTTSHRQHAFRYEGTTGMVDLDPLGRSSTAMAVNDLGQIVGSSVTVDGLTTATVFTNDSLIYLGTLGGCQEIFCSVATGINDSGDVIGRAHGPSGAETPFLYHDGVMRDLNELISDPGWIMRWATAINDAGQIVGYAVPRGGSTGHAVLLTPIVPSDRLTETPPAQR
jgi:probable HAF family extracellular repeat protein